MSQNRRTTGFQALSNDERSFYGVSWKRKESSSNQEMI